MSKKSQTTIAFYTAISILIVSVALSVASLYPVSTGERHSKILINDSFTLTQNEIRYQGLGAFRGNENVSLQVTCPTAFTKNFSIITYDGLYYANCTDQDIAFTFNAETHYYEAVFHTDSSDSGVVYFTVTVEEPLSLFPLSWLTAPAKTLFALSLGAAFLILLKQAFLTLKTKQSNTNPLQTWSKTTQNSVLALLLLSLFVWFGFLAVNSYPYATFENWYTDHPRHSYVASLFVKDGLEVFSQPLGPLASQDGSSYKFVTWPEMPHLYPAGSILLFLPFGALLQNGFEPALIYKLQVVLFLVVAHVCMYFFLKNHLGKPMRLPLKLLGVYVTYVTLVIYAANGMFDSVAFLFATFAVAMFLVNRYDLFFLLTAVSTLFKYQTGIFLFPLIIVGLLQLAATNKLANLLQNKTVMAGAVFFGVSGFTAALSAPYLMGTRAEMIMNGVNAFSSHSQIPWFLQSFAVLLTLAATLTYVFYMHNKNSLLALSALFMLLPSFLLPYFQNWYLPFIFIYILIPKKKLELEATMVWLVFMVAVLSFGGASFNPLNIIDNLRVMLRL